MVERETGTGGEAMKARIVSLLTAIFFCCPLAAVGQNPYPPDCNTFTVQVIHCNDDEGGNQQNCTGQQTVITFTDGPGPDSENPATLACQGNFNCGSKGLPACCKNVGGWLTPEPNEQCNSGGTGSGGTDPECPPPGDVVSKTISPHPLDDLPDPPPCNDGPGTNATRARPIVVHLKNATPEQRKEAQAIIDAHIADLRAAQAAALAKRRLEDKLQ
jgi:hypothetical protein